MNELMNFINDNPTIFAISFASSLLANVITITSIFRIFRKREVRPYNLSWFTKKTLRSRLEKALNTGNHEDEIICRKYLNWVKLYSKDSSEQETAITELYHSKNDIEETLLIFFERLGREPELSFTNKTLLIKIIKELSKKL